MLNYIQPKNLETEAQGDMQSLEARKRIAELMSGIATQQLQAPTSGGIAGRLPSWAPIVQALAGGLAGMQQKSILGDQQKILEAQQEGDANTLGALMRARQFQPATEQAGPPLPGQSMPTTPASGGEFTPEYKAALIQAIASGSPRLQPFIKAELEHVNKNAIGPVDLKDRATLGSIQQNPGDFTKWTQKQNIHAAGDQFFNIDESGGVTHLGGQNYADPFMFGGDLMQNAQYGGKVFSVNQGPKINISANAVNQAEGAFAKGLGEDTAKAVQAARDANMNGQKLIHFADKLEELDKSGVFSGPTANIQTFTTNLANTFGIPVDTQKLANSEAYASGIMRQVSQMMTASGGVGRSFSDADREAYMKQFPQLVQSPEGRARIINELRANGTMDLQHSRGVEARLREAYPEHARLLDVAPVNTPYQPPPKVSQKPSGGPQPVRRRWNPETGRIE